MQIREMKAICEKIKQDVRKQGLLEDDILKEKEIRTILSGDKKYHRFNHHTNGAGNGYIETSTW